MDIQTKVPWEDRPWGRFYTVYHTPHIWVKTLIINPRSELSLQFHDHREEHWSVTETGLSANIGSEYMILYPGHSYHVGFKVLHRILNLTHEPKILTEVAWGDPDENDITRLQDRYGRVQ